MASASINRSKIAFIKKIEANKYVLSVKHIRDGKIYNICMLDDKGLDDLISSLQKVRNG